MSSSMATVCSLRLCTTAIYRVWTPCSGLLTETPTLDELQHLLEILLCVAFSYAFPAFPETEKKNEEDMQFAEKYLEKYYKLKTEAEPIFKMKNSKAITDKIREMQEFFGLKVTGELDSKTLEVMKQSRCGIPDVGQFRTFPGSPRWTKTDLKYRILNYTPDMEPADVNEAIEKAWNVWSSVTPLKFTRVYEGDADIMISFAAGCKRIPMCQ
ncbi:interstitial collagenase-like [Chelonoidis abingdonii]|uniref:interstitial collagenase-like n=1 Tax=Chelonoidis abingdonii TaxID=106734 RepID=UPI003F49A8CA